MDPVSIISAALGIINAAIQARQQMIDNDASLASLIGKTKTFKFDAKTQKCLMDSHLFFILDLTITLRDTLERMIQKITPICSNEILTTILQKLQMLAAFVEKYRKKTLFKLAINAVKCYSHASEIGRIRQDLMDCMTMLGISTTLDVETIRQQDVVDIKREITAMSRAILDNITHINSDFEYSFKELQDEIRASLIPVFEETMRA